MKPNTMNDKKYANLIVKSVHDQKLEQENPQMKYSYNIQAGAAQTAERIGDFYDNEGTDHISELNVQFCELTVMYWAWKNVKTDYVGSSHYRRSFNITEQQLERFFEAGIDVIFPTAVEFNVSVEEQYKTYSYSEPFDEMMKVIYEKYPEYYSTAQAIMKGSIFIPFNMAIMKKDYFDGYCEWLFSILFEVYYRIGDKRDVYQNRYCAFLAERMALIYASYHANERKFEFANVVMSNTRDFVYEQILALPQEEREYLAFANRWIEGHNIHPLEEIGMFVQGTGGVFKKIDLFSVLVHANHLEMRYQSNTFLDYYNDIEELLRDYQFMIEQMNDEQLYLDAENQKSFLSFLSKHHVSKYTLAYVAIAYNIDLLKMAKFMSEHGDEQTAILLRAYAGNQ